MNKDTKANQSPDASANVELVQGISLTDEQRFLFDLNGWVCLSGVLTESETASIREHVITLKNDPQSLPPKQRYPFAGPGQQLLDHPALVGALGEFLEQPKANAYGFRMEGAFGVVRPAGHEDRQLPHRGPQTPPFAYSFQQGRSYSGLTRVVWELNPVEKGDGATAFLSGSHKMNLPIPDSIRRKDSPWLDQYECPAGSMVIFAESTIHAGLPWGNEKWPRMAILFAYSMGVTQWHKMNLPAEVVQQFTPAQQTLFRGVWGHDFHNRRTNDYFSAENQAL